MAKDWLELRQHAETGIETIKAHFEGHAFDPHWHDSYLVGITLNRHGFNRHLRVI
ncbi:AraC family transcriptional regulator [Enterobacter hormaechei]|nr:AraC family transcriptional regulator [Enterobacter hormaechei]